MAEIILIMGKSGTGKTTSLRNFKKEELGVISVEKPRLPFKTDITPYSTKDYNKIKSALVNGKTNTLVIDDSGYLITDEFMRKANEKGYQKFTDLADHFYDLISFVKEQVDKDKIVYLVMHEDENDKTLEIKPKTIGKLLDEKVVIEGRFDIVLRTIKTDEGYFFRTQSNGYDVAKSPMGMFSADMIPNDLKAVDDIIREFYNIGGRSR
jgi:adenylate kinase family enzyme